MKILKFKAPLCQQISVGQKTSTWRLFDDKDLQVGDSLDFVNSDTGEVFGSGMIISLYIKTFRTLEEADWQGHDRFSSDEEMCATFQSYYQEEVGPDTEIKIVTFSFNAMKPRIFNKIVVVDEFDNVIGAERLPDAIQKGLIRRAARVCVFNESGALLIQQRSENVLDPLLLDHSAAGHVDEGETYEQTACRELEEELGISGFILESIVHPYWTTNYYNALYRVMVPDNIKINFSLEEIKQVFWYDQASLQAKIANNPAEFTPAFNETWALFGDRLFK